MVRSLALLFCSLIVFCVLTNRVHAESKVTTTIQLPDGKHFDVDIINEVSPRGQEQLRFETSNMSKIVLGYGRDLDGDNEVETFFLIGDSEVKTYNYANPNQKSVQRAAFVLARHAKYSGGAYLNGVFERVTRFWLMSENYIHDVMKVFYQDLMDLEELKIKLQQSKVNLSRAEYFYVLQVLGDGEKLAWERLDKHLHREYVGLLGADAVMLISGGIMAKRAVVSAASKVTLSLEVGLRLTFMNYQIAVQQTLKAITVRSALSFGKNLIIKSIPKVTYIAVSTATQLAVETAINWKDVEDPDPIVLARNMLEHPVLQENVKISLTDNIVGTAAMSLTKNKIAQFAILGVVAAGSSMIMGKDEKGEQPKGRVIFDTAYSLGIDNIEMILDQVALARFAQLAIKTRNPKLRFAGWAVVVVFQGATSWIYNKGANHFEPKEGKLKLLPIAVNINK